MSRRNKNFTRNITPDPVYNSKVVERFINKVMYDGKKSTSRRIVYDAILKLSEQVKEAPLESFEKALKNVMPLMEVRSRRVGGSTYQVPVEVKSGRALSLAMRWIIGHARTRNGRSMTEQLAQELIDAFNRVGTSIKKREETHKMAESNKAFAHFRW